MEARYVCEALRLRKSVKAPGIRGRLVHRNMYGTPMDVTANYKSKTQLALSHCLISLDQNIGGIQGMVWGREREN